MNDQVKERIWLDILVERKKQDVAHGGQINDDYNGPQNWLTLIVKYLGRATYMYSHTDEAKRNFYRYQMIKVAALVVAAIESFDRKCSDQKR